MNIQKNSSDRFNLLTKNYIPWGSLGKNNATCSKIVSELIRTKAIDNFYSTSADTIEKFIKQINDFKKKFRTIVYISGHKCYPMMSRQAQVMKNNGYKTFLINMEPLKLNDLKSLLNCFDDILSNCLFFPMLQKILKKIKPDFFHIQCWMFSYHLGKFIIKNKGKSKVICDFYDVTGMYAEEKHLKSIFDEFNVEQDLENEKFIFNNADGIIHRYKQNIFLDFSKKYKRKKNILEFQQYPLKIIDLKRKYKGEKLKFVYCGTLIPPNDKNHPKELFNGAGLIYAFDYILRSGHELNIYLPLNGTYEFNKWIFDLKDTKYPHTLKIHDSMPIENLIEEISKYDLGINVQKIYKETSKISEFTYTSCMGTKNYTYLEAGLPILVNDEYSYMKELVEENNIGLSLKSNNLSQINTFLKKIDIDLLKENVRKFNIKNNLFVKGDLLKGFYESL